MRIAVPTNDGETLSAHFGRSSAFLVFETEERGIKSREVRANGPCHAEGESCGHGSEHAGGHNHDSIVSIISDCSVVLCGGMGRRAADALKAAGISVVPVANSGDAAEIVGAYLEGKISQVSGGLCSCGH